MNRLNTITRAALAAALSLALSANAANLRVVDAWIQEGPPSLTVQAGYLVLENTSAETLRITGVVSPLAERVEIHRSDITENTATMTRITELPLPARGKVSFSPGGYHLMIYGIREAPRAGAQVPLEIHTADGQVVKVNATVRRDEAASADGAASGDHDGHDAHDHH